LRSLQTCAEADAELVVFPELYLGGYVLDQRLTLKAEQAERALSRLQAAVDELGLSAVLGLPLRHGAALLNGVAMLCPGAPTRFCGKTHLFQAEKEWFAPGRDLWQAEIAGWPCGLVVCYELGFPEVARVLALRGARLLLAPSAFAARREHIWRAATVARALENSCYLAAANHAGPFADGAFLGASRIVDPRGMVVAEAGDSDEVLYADLDAALVDEVRAGDGGGHTYFVDRRPELYAEISRRAE
ncbi:MAG: carbon-nitrogen hydrolase family protein, partial [Actinobacteria bacterium]|nr:carbon-nitrogen hydrolase family protein [Actinomycetota bacterium]